MNAMPAGALPGDAEVPPQAPPLRLVTGFTPAPSRPAPGIPARPAQEAPLRLTRRGRVVVATVVALAVAVLSLLAAGAAQATNHFVPSRHNLVRVVVRPGQSLWSVAENADPDQDTRLVVKQIIDLNSLSSDTVFAGQQLWVPRG